MLLGSHLDTVRNGGRFDGALGVLAALHVLIAIRAAGITLPLALEAIDFTDEEGSLVSFLGSASLTGQLRPESLQAPRGGRAALLVGLACAGLQEARLTAARRDPATLAGYVELHVEQGPRLEQEDAQIGVVTAIAGRRAFSITFHGQAAHAGTTPDDARRDAGLGAAAFILAVAELIRRDFPNCVATVGDAHFEPGAFNVVPGSAELSLEFRAGRRDRLDALERAIRGQACAGAAERGLEVEIVSAGDTEPTQLDADICVLIERVAGELGLRSLRLPSGAGHDAQMLAAIAPSGMIFVPSVGGVSHHPDEYTRWEDAVNGANLLLQTALALSERWIDPTALPRPRSDTPAQMIVDTEEMME